MRYENKFWHRDGHRFFNQTASVDLSGLRYLHTGVDTIKQLYNCLIRHDVLCAIQQAYDGGDNVFSWGGLEWLITRSSKEPLKNYLFLKKHLKRQFFKIPAVCSPLFFGFSICNLPFW